MARGKSYFFLIDNLTADKVPLLKRGLLEVSAVLDVKADVRSGLVEVRALKKIEDAVISACSIAGLQFRTQVDKKDL